MKIRFEQAEELMKGLGYLQEELGFTLSGEGDYTVSVIRRETAGFEAELKGRQATVTYGGGKVRFFRGFAYLMDAIRRGEERWHLAQTPTFETNGPMLDMSGCSVMNVSAIEFMLRRQALMGLNMAMLYTEDTYEVEGYPYFGHFRGRYTKEELRHLDAYAGDLGIELIPCIQVLGHLGSLLQWEATAPFKDNAAVLLAGAEETERLIGAMFQAVCDCFTTKRVHIGMDETFGLGLGAYLKKNSYREEQEIYLEHLQRVAALAGQYGLEPMIWSDMLFRFGQEHLEHYRTFDERVTLSEELCAMIPQNVGQVCWIYDTVGKGFGKDFYLHAMKELQRLGNKVWFAGAVRNWSGYLLQYGVTLTNTRVGLQAAKEAGVREVIATVWGGRDCNLIASLPGLALYADIDYRGGYDAASVEECFRVSCQAEQRDFLQFEVLDRPNLKENEYGVSRQVLFNDPLLPLLDLDLQKYDMGRYYKEILPLVESIPQPPPAYRPLFDMLRALGAVLVHKADFGIRLKAAYDADDRAALAALLEECPLILERLKELKERERILWFTYHKPFGWEVNDLRYGGLMARFETVQLRLTAYLNGAVDSIPELAEPRLSYTGHTEPGAVSALCRYDGCGTLMTRNFLKL